MKSIACDSALKKCVDTFNKTNTMAHEEKKAGQTLFIHLYGTKAEKLTLYTLPSTQFHKAVKKNTPTQEFLPPTSASAVQCLFRIYHEIQQWLGNKLKPEKCG